MILNYDTKLHFHTKTISRLSRPSPFNFICTKLKHIVISCQRSNKKIYIVWNSSLLSMFTKAESYCWPVYLICIVHVLPWMTWRGWCGVVEHNIRPHSEVSPHAKYIHNNITCECKVSVSRTARDRGIRTQPEKLGQRSISKFNGFGISWMRPMRRWGGGQRTTAAPALAIALLFTKKNRGMQATIMHFIKRRFRIKSIIQ